MQLSQSWKRKAKQPLDPGKFNLSLLIVGGCVIMISVIAIVSSYLKIRSLILAKFTEQSHLKVTSVTHEIDQWLATLLSQVEASANHPAIRSLDWEQAEPYLQLELGRLPDFYMMVLVRPDGSYYTTRDGFIPNINLRDRRHFQEAMAGRSVIDDPVISRSTGIPPILIGTPIWSTPPFKGEKLESKVAEIRSQSLTKLGLSEAPPQPIGELTGAVTLERISEIINNISPVNGSYAFLLDSQGVPIVYPDERLVQEAQKLTAYEDITVTVVTEAMVNREQGGQWLRDPEAGRFYIAYAPLKQANWSFALMIPYSPVREELNRLNWLALGAGEFLILAVLIWVRLKISQTESEQRFRATFEQSPVGICHCDLEGNFLWVNQKYCEILGYTPEELKSRNFQEITHPHDLDKNVEDIRRLFRGEISTCLVEKRYVTKEGYPIWAAVTIALAKDTKNVPKYSIVIVEDIEDRKHAEAALKESETRLREMLQRENLLNQLATQIRNSLELETILETAVTQIRHILQVERCHFLWVRNCTNKLTLEVVNESKDHDLISHRGCYVLKNARALVEVFLSLKLIYTEDITTILDEKLQEFLLDLEYIGFLAIPLKTSDDQVGAICCGQHKQKRYWQEAELEFLQGVVDQLAIAISQADLYAETQKAAYQYQVQAEELVKTLEELKTTQTQLIQNEKMSSLGQMVAGVAHEINNPVSFIYGNLVHVREYSEGLLKFVEQYQTLYPNPPAELAELAEEIDLEFMIQDLPKILKSMEVGAKRIQEIVVSLRTFSRLDEGEFKEVNIHQGLDSTLMILNNRLKAQADRPEIQVIKKYDDLPEIECYASQLNQVFMNLLTNAIDAIEEAINQGKFSENSDQVPTIHIETELADVTETQQSQSVYIRIKDNGVGIPDEVQPQLFDPFFTTKPVGKGTGLGLSISYQLIVDKHQGQLQCRSQLGIGTEFIISIPIKRG